jgi:hypothetical protein
MIYALKHVKDRYGWKSKYNRILLVKISNIDLKNLYRVSQEGRSIFWEVIVSVTLSKKVYMYMCPIPNGFRDSAISLYRGATRHVLTRVAKCIDVDGGIFENVLH